VRRVRRTAWAGPRPPRRIRLRRALGRTRLGYVVKRALRRARLPALLRHGDLQETGNRRGPQARRKIQNVLLVSHCDFTGNSALHAYSIATELHRRGLSPAIAVPENPGSVSDLGEPPFPVLTFRDVGKGRLDFPNGGPPDVVHAFTPRERVRKLTVELVREHACPYVVHLEDNEGAIAAGVTHPDRRSAFIATAAGATVVIERLLEFKPARVPGVVVWPGFDEAVLSPLRSRAEIRAELGAGAEQVLLLVYNGNVHNANLDEVCSLYAAVSLLRAAGHPALLVKTGWNFVPSSRLPDLGDALIDLGWVARVHVPELLAAADVLVQPGRSDPLNDYRFPSKLPEFLASGKPVVLPRANIGLHLENGVEALLLERGDAEEICAKVALLARDPALRTHIGERGHQFALRELRWSNNVERIVELYRRIE
jgi:glycosyltransferase involved in cell wall biosynthesis